MKKLMVVVISALVLFMAPLAVAGQSGWGAIQGTYAMIATGSCLYSTLGFLDRTPYEGSVVWGATTTAQAVWTFDSRGNGTVTHGWNYVLDFPPGSPTFGGPIARQNAFSFNFHYEIDHDGVITIYPPSPPNILGAFSKDHKMVTLGSANYPQDSPVGPVICNTARTLYWVSD
jgi:hypothetical protein